MYIDARKCALAPCSLLVLARAMDSSFQVCSRMFDCLVEQKGAATSESSSATPIPTKATTTSSSSSANCTAIIIIIIIITTWAPEHPA
mmetsp:Transcript_11506/g.17108  ORF Transcript_11506/g.17108 Transcript_11506/m.17108 type:complete len:88 (-) Transcript_11506:190-453(-)